jgi:hypothetical protein
MVGIGRGFGVVNQVRIGDGDPLDLCLDEAASGIIRISPNRSMPPMIPTPQQLFARFERGEIGREELQALMAVHARELIAEMEDDYQNPAAAWLEALLARRAMGRLVRRHGSRLLREVLVALSELADFAPAHYLWNATHPDVPLHCFLRMRRQPVFRIAAIDHQSEEITVLVEHGDAGRGRATRRIFVMKRDEQWHLRARPAG